MGKFIKRSIVIEAMQLRWDNWGEMCDFAKVGDADSGRPHGCYVSADGHPLFDGQGSDEIGLLIPTLEGTMLARQNDWVVKGIKGELYPVKDAIFRDLYDPLEPSTHSW